MKKLFAGFVCVLLVVSLAACGAQSAGTAADDGGYKYKNEMMSTDVAAGEALFDSAMREEVKPMAQAVASQSVYQNSGVKLIRRANLQVQTVEFDKSVAALEQLVLSLNGYYENAELYSGGYYNQGSHRSGYYVVRIPAESYDSFMSQIDGVGYLSRRTESTQDVGQEYFDAESRLTTQRTKQERLQQLLKQARNMEDIIALENALADVEYQIEQYTSQLRRYDSLVGYATIDVNIQEMQRITDDPGQQAGLLQRMKTGIVSSAGDVVDGVQNFLVWVSYNLIGLAILAAVAVGGVFAGRKYVKVRRAKKAAKAAAEEKEQ